MPATLTMNGRNAPLPTLMVATSAATLVLMLAGCGGGTAGGGSGNGYAVTSAPTAGATGSPTVFCADVAAVVRDAAVVNGNQQPHISASVFDQYTRAAEHLAAEAPSTPSTWRKTPALSRATSPHYLKGPVMVLPPQTSTRTLHGCLPIPPLTAQEGYPATIWEPPTPDLRAQALLTGNR